jgi:alkanesulfonate monooxygenase SsuD/methylene tetrahydromethanopterin reductase-like flavin-dependent oxidoreductase (luciferase family)
VWVVEDCFYGGGIAQAGVALASTKQLRVGMGIMPAVARNAAFTAMEFATLARMFPGRFLPGLGHGVKRWMQQIHEYPTSPLGALEEHTRAVRAILHGENVSIQGTYVQLDNVQLYHPLTEVPPVSLGVRGPKSLNLSGRISDGTILAEGVSIPYLLWARQQIDVGRQAANRTDSHRITVYLPWTVADDKALAYKQVRPLIGHILADNSLAYAEALGISDQVQALMATGGRDHLQTHMPVAWIDALAVVGTAQDCATTIHHYYEAGADSVVLVPLLPYERVLESAEVVLQALT